MECLKGSLDSNRQNKLCGFFGDGSMQQKCCTFFLEPIDIALFKESIVLIYTGSFFLRKFTWQYTEKMQEESQAD